MKIKEVEKLTGLTAKSIRLYESKGLLKIDRNNDNDYREFTEENVAQLKFIKTMRYLDFSIQEIGDLMDASEETVKQALRDKQRQYAEEGEIIERKQRLCQTLAEDFSKSHTEGVIDEYLEYIAFAESEEMAELKKQMEEAKHPSIATVCCQTLVCLGPILWLWIYVAEEKWEMLKWNIPVALIATVFLTLLWRKYLTNRRRNREYQKKRNAGSWLLLPCILAVLVVMIAVFVVLAMLQAALFSADGWLFYQSTALGIFAIVCVELPLIALVLSLLYRFKKNGEWEWGADVVCFLKKHWIPTLLVWLGLFYFALTDITVVTEDRIIVHDWLHPAGETYSYADVTHIETGYSDKWFSITQKRGTFYYRICLEGRWVELGSPSVNEDIVRYEDTYLELEELDAALMAHHPQKTSNRDNEEFAQLDQRYIDRFGRIIDNRP